VKIDYPSFRRPKLFGRLYNKIIKEKMVWRGAGTTEEEGKFVKDSGMDDVPVEYKDIQVILSEEDLDELDNLARRDFVVEEVSEEDEI